jgi:hypothetical protein
MAPRLPALHEMAEVSPRTDVAFVHIPKTAGSAIELAAWRGARLAWGIFYERGRWRLLRERACALVPDAACALEVERARQRRAATPACVRANATCLRAFGAERGAITSCPSPAPAETNFGPWVPGDAAHVRAHCCDWWHVPPPKLALDPRPYYALAPRRFCVVRDPYERLLSAYMAHWFATKAPAADMCAHPLLTGNGTRGVAYSLAAWVALLDRGYKYVRPELRRRHAPESEWTGWSACPLNCWFEPQSAYLARSFVYVEGLRRFDEAVEPAARGCNIVLRHENLGREFEALMRWAALDVRLPQPAASKTKPGRSRGSTCFTAAGARALLAPPTRALVQRWYARDFELLGYPT